MITPLHTHSSYSFLEALPSPAELVQAAVEAGHARPGSHRPQPPYRRPRVLRRLPGGAGVQPILGLELDVSPPTTSPPIPRDKQYRRCCRSPGFAGPARPGSVRVGPPSAGSPAWPNPIPPARRPVPFDQLGCRLDRSDLPDWRFARPGLPLAVSAIAGPTAGRPLDLWLDCLGEAFPSRLYVELQLQIPCRSPSA